ncbi:MAG: hypothetical protein IJY56_03890 [Clostridia bacterium]|nr:hypothetical protein [Clostridia bacterium]
MCNNDTVFLLLGGDERMFGVYDYLKSRDVTARLYGFDLKNDQRICSKHSLEDLIRESDAVILPTPVVSNGELFAPYSKDLPSLEKLSEMLIGKRVYGGGKSALISEKCIYTDLLDDEWLVIRNAELTAEAAISEAVNSINRSISDSNVLIVGNGRIGKQLRRLLKEYTSDLTVSARKNRDMAEIELSGAKYINTSEIAKNANRFDLIFSTVPAKVFDYNLLKELKEMCLLIDLASAPGSADIKAVNELNIKYVFAKALPGRYFPLSSGEAIAKTVLRLYGGEINA